MKNYATLAAGAFLFAVGCGPRAESGGRGGMLEDSLHVATGDDSTFRSAGDTLRAPVEAPPFQIPGGAAAIGMDADSGSSRDTNVARVDSAGSTRFLAPSEPGRK